MNMKKFISGVLTSAMLMSAASAFAQIPETKVDTVDNAAVIAFGDVTASQSMRIEGDVYAGGLVKFDNAGENYLDGDIISPNEVQYSDEYSAILKSTNRNGVDRVEDISGVLDAYYPDKYLIDNAVKPQTPSYDDVVFDEKGWVSVNTWTTTYDNARNVNMPVYENDENGYPTYTISESTSFDGLTLNGAKLVIDSSEAPVYLKSGMLSGSVADGRASYIEIIGDNPVYLIAPATDLFLNVVRTGENQFDFGKGNVTWIVTSNGNPWVAVGSTDANSKMKADIYYDAPSNDGGLKINAPMVGNVVTDAAVMEFGNTSVVEGDIYSYGETKFAFDGKLNGDIVTKASEVIISNSGQYNDERVSGNINAINAQKMNVSCSIMGNIVTSAEELIITGGANTDHVANIQGTVYAPKAETKIYATSDKGIRRGQLICDSLIITGEGAVIWGKADNTEPENTPAPTATPAPIPDDDEIDLMGAKYAYIFGYEPKISYEYNEGDETGKLVAQVEMAPDDAVTREQIAAMIMRLIDQKYDTKTAKYAMTDNIKQHTGTWYARGLAFLAGKGAFDGVDSVETGAVTRGEVAKLVAYGLNLSKTTETAFADIADSQYKTYIEIMAAYNYMNGVDDDKFEPNRVMTRAEFCAMFNNIIGRTNATLVSPDGVKVTPELYSIVDLDGHWAEDTMLKATSVYDDNGAIDIQTRLDNIRNVLDNYDGQKWF